MRLAILAVVVGLAARGHAQVDTGNGHAPPPRANLDLPRDALDFSSEQRDIRVPPEWRDVERVGAAAFRPAADVVSDRPSPALVALQLNAFLAAERAIEEGHGDPAITAARDPRAELRRRFEEEPAEWRRAQVVVQVGADGALEAANVVGSSGRRDFDLEALRAVRRAVERRCLSVKARAIVVFACDAGVIVPPPMLGQAAGDLRNQGVTAGFRVHFDENSGRIDPLVPLVRRVVTRVRIVDYQNR